MEGLEAMQLADKTFDALSDEEKKKWFNDLIENAEKNDSIKRLKEKWWTLTQEQKLKLYKRNSVDFSGYIKNYPLYRIGSSIIDWVKNTQKRWWKYAMTYWVLEHIPCRFFVELGILDKPEWLENKQLINDIEKDAKNFKTYLWVCEAVCSVIPEAKAAIPFIWMAKKYAKWYEKNWAPLMQEKMRQKEFKSSEEDIAKGLSASEENILQSQIEKQAA